MTDNRPKTLQNTQQIRMSSPLRLKNSHNPFIPQHLPSKNSWHVYPLNCDTLLTYSKNKERFPREPFKARRNPFPLTNLAQPLWMHEFSDHNFANSLHPFDF